MIRIGLALDTQTIQPGNRLLPAINPVGVAMVIDKKSISIKVSGSVSGDIIGFLTKFFKSKICSLVTKEVIDQINT